MNETVQMGEFKLFESSVAIDYGAAVTEFMKYDPRGDAFRFPEHRKAGRLLADVGGFDVSKFENRWKKLSRSMDQIDEMVDSQEPILN